MISSVCFDIFMVILALPPPTLWLPWWCWFNFCVLFENYRGKINMTILGAVSPSNPSHAVGCEAQENAKNKILDAFLSVSQLISCKCRSYFFCLRLIVSLWCRDFGVRTELSLILERFFFRYFYFAFCFAKSFSHVWVSIGVAPTTCNLWSVYEKLFLSPSWLAIISRGLTSALIFFSNYASSTVLFRSSSHRVDSPGFISIPNWSPKRGNITETTIEVGAERLMMLLARRENNRNPLSFHPSIDIFLPFTFRLALFAVLIKM